MRSALYPCTVTHRRFAPKAYEFKHRVFMLAVDLDEWADLGWRFTILSIDRSGFYSLRDEDFLPTSEPLCRAVKEPEGPTSGLRLKERVLARLRAHGIALPEGVRVTLVTMPRTVGYLFNPVSFYFVADMQGAPLAAIAEVTNTFREVKNYPMGPECLEHDASGAPCFRLRAPKYFYVSPFSPPDGEFEFVLHPPDERLRLRVDHYVHGVRTLAAPLSGERRNLSDGRLALETLTCPAVTLKTMVLIHLHAAVLWLKGVPWWAKTASRELQTDLRRSAPPD